MTLLRRHRLVFLDESSCATGMRRDFAWSCRRSQAFSTRPFGKWKTVSLGAIRIGCRPKLMTYRGAVNGRVFLRYVEDAGSWAKQVGAERLERVLAQASSFDLI